ncbi:polysaccharide pyruvyl transferase CsaB [candidate division WOR-1 bacterium RIFOXYB2_FULL_42_35]|uniref:Polysaccharide pyruvyl transferase CsaB n=1 Tax=candidate division WOR-1 bacterium RIFOXYC2_FULL_41_25 TaxID=1802586 RepID=A0A1F4TNG9_UNCSA|nr:MAG: polysaccharide pyruvyl transferase CsaB [candidate division WOR-1 bacterium RIFOXYA2_FULL_41_14]OGC24502.1 MAG: polysaccharide pyruvyl transferase CsaB [candidate division WOR-1 bacterium RIFOXYB2_FULL_42_35]OGC34119.1 MAG: polysaccharide pyruvyl transferase CsaB [candidate division WOR-1 bacterium RIFOXYC2_FULL_41_25]OGC42813.1 MAG: polysaccharide pyruvyl transferase CsaB [candidate division WOR-1 bacterium RIFOXYD2_FULL_41_8]
MKILVSGYYGFGNLGDEAILASIIEGFGGYDKEIKLTVLSQNPEQTSSCHCIPAINRNKVRETIKALRDCDVFLSGGGGLLQDKTSSRSLLYYLGLIRLAKLLGKKVYVFAQGIGPIKSRVNQLLLKNTLEKVDLITVRDNNSFIYLNQLKLKNPKILNTADATFILEPEEGQPLLEQAGIKKNKQRLIGFSLRNLTKAKLPVETLAGLADNLAETLQAKIIFIPCQRSTDIEVINQVMNKMTSSAAVISREYRPRELLAIITQLDLVVGMRLHCLIFSALARVPAIGLAYDPKVTSFMEEVSLPCFEIKDLVPTEIVLTAKELLDNSVGIKQSLDFSLRKLQAKARLNFGMIELMANN